MCTTSSADAALIQKGQRGRFREGSPDNNGASGEKGAAKSRQERGKGPDAGALKWPKFIFMQKITRHHTCTVAAETKESFQGKKP